MVFEGDGKQPFEIFPSEFSLQKVLEVAYREGHRDFRLRGEWRAEDSQDSLLRFHAGFTDVTIECDAAVLDGQHQTAHVVLVEPGARAWISGAEIRNGSTVRSRGRPAAAGPMDGDRHIPSLYRFIDGANVLVCQDASLTLHQVVCTGGESGMCGGGISVQGGHLHCEDSLIAGNSAFHTGGGIDLLVPGSIVDVRNTIFVHNTSNAGSRLGGPHGQISVFPRTVLIAQDCILIPSGPDDLFLDHQSGCIVDCRGSVIVTSSAQQHRLARLSDSGLRSAAVYARHLARATRLMGEQWLSGNPVVPGIAKGDSASFERMWEERKMQPVCLTDPTRVESIEMTAHSLKDRARDYLPG